MKYLMPLILSLLLLCACGGHEHNDPVLVAADSLMDSQPQQALAILDTVNCAHFRTADSAYYALLHTQARVLNYQPVNDTLINTATRFYSQTAPNSLNAIRAHYLQGYVAYEHSRLPDAVTHSLAAYETAESSHPFWAAKSATLLADIYAAAYNDRNAVDRYRRSAQLFLMAGDTTRHRYALADAAMAHLNSWNVDAGYALCDSIYRHAAQDKDTALMRYVAIPPIKLTIKLNDTTRTNYSFNAMRADAIQQMEQEAVSDDRMVSALLSDAASVPTLLRAALAQSATDADSIQTMYLLYRNFQDTQHYREASELADTLLAMQSQKCGRLLEESVTQQEANFYYKQAENHRLRSKYMLRLCIMIGIAALAMLTAAAAYYIAYRRKKEAEASQQLLSLLTLQRDLEALQSQSQETKAGFAQTAGSLMHDKWRIINKLCHEYMSIENGPKLKNAIFDKIDAEISDLKTQKQIDEIERSVNICYNNLMTRLREQCPFFNKEQYTILTLIYAGLDNHAIRLITGIEYKAYYQRRKRIKDKIKEHNPPDAADFLEKLG